MEMKSCHCHFNAIHNPITYLSLNILNLEELTLMKQMYTNYHFVTFFFYGEKSSMIKKESLNSQLINLQILNFLPQSNNGRAK